MVGEGLAKRPRGQRHPPARIGDALGPQTASELAQGARRQTRERLRVAFIEAKRAACRSRIAQKIGTRGFIGEQPRQRRLELA
jgi:hypothetical protein